MPFIPTIGAALVAVNYDWHGQKCNNTLWFIGDGSALDVTALTSLAGMVQDYWVDAIMPQLSSEISYRGCIAYAQDSESAPAVASTGVNVPGGVVIPSVPNSVTWAIKFTTAGRGKSSRGRNYIPGIPATAVEDNTVDGAFATNMVTAYSGLIDEAAANSFTWVIVSHFSLGLPRVAGVYLTVSGVGFSDLIIDSQRRRLPGRGT